MAKSKEDIKYATTQAKLSEDEALRVGYKAGTPIEGGKIADSQPVDLFSSAHNISTQQQNDEGKIADSEPVDLFSSARNFPIYHSGIAQQSIKISSQKVTRKAKITSSRQYTDGKLKISSTMCRDNEDGETLIARKDEPTSTAIARIVPAQGFTIYQASLGICQEYI
ncbi:hypothetical protein DH2020_033116 [Rehmannia glutinosa]|uniref:Uncharacterized protein n=1 Tax=Rehmannia glutinosa TaxID=99300 RepID=A0ABR0VGE4_REHGL